MPFSADGKKLALILATRSLSADGRADVKSTFLSQILKPGSDSSDELMFSDFEKAYKRMGEEFSQVIALEEVQEIFEHFQVITDNKSLHTFSRAVIKRDLC